MAYFDRSGEASDEAGRWANFNDLPALHLAPGIAFQPIATDSVMTNFVIFEPTRVGTNIPPQGEPYSIEPEHAATISEATRPTRKNTPPVFNG